jgi:hypothetical protein
VLARVSQPLQPLRGDLDVGEVDVMAVFDDSAEPTGVENVFELPEGVSGEVGAWKSWWLACWSPAKQEASYGRAKQTAEKLFAPWQSKRLPLEPEFSEWGWARNDRHYGMMIRL